jgi:hypothetical protein
MAVKTGTVIIVLDRHDNRGWFEDEFWAFIDVSAAFENMVDWDDLSSLWWLVTYRLRYKHATRESSNASGDIR